MDGFLARRFDVCTEHGRILDSVCDIILVIVLVLSLINRICWEWWMVLWIVAIACVRITAFLIGTHKRHSAAFIHSSLNRLAGLAVFSTPFLLSVLSDVVTVVVVCVVATLASVDYLAQCYRCSE